MYVCVCVCVCVCVYVYLYVRRYVCVRASAHDAMGHWSFPHGGPIEQLLVSAGAPRLVEQSPWHGAYKRTLAASPCS